MSLDTLRRIFSFGMRDPHEVKQGPDYRRPDDRRDVPSNQPKRDATPPREARTDPDRGTGELGEGEIDPDRPLTDPMRRP
jgi:hypothetical protein